MVEAKGVHQLVGDGSRGDTAWDLQINLVVLVVQTSSHVGPTSGSTVANSDVLSF